MAEIEIDDEGMIFNPTIPYARMPPNIEIQEVLLLIG